MTSTVITKSVAEGIGVGAPVNDAVAAGGAGRTGLSGDLVDIITTADLNMPTTIVGTTLIEELVTLTTDNDTLTDMDNGDGDSVPNSPVVTAFVAAALSLIIILTVGGNILVVLSPIVSKRLRTVTYTFLVSLAVADLLLGITVLPWSAIYTISSEWPFSVVFCNIYISCDVMFCTASILHLLVISLERYFAITRPYAYQRKMNHRKATTVIIVVWVVSLGVSFLPLHLGWNTSDGSVQNYNHPTQCILTWNMAYALFDGILLFFLPLILMLFVYARIVTIAYHQAKAIQSLMVTPAPSIRTPAPDASSSQEKQENANNNHKNVVDEHKAVRIIAVVMGSFVVCWVPYFTMFTFGPLCNWAISDLFYNIVLWLGYVNSLINPLVYALMNREFRRAFKTILSCARWNTKCIGSFGSRDYDSQIKFPANNQANSRYNGSTVTYSTSTYTGSISSQASSRPTSRKPSENYAKLFKAEGDIAEVSEPDAESSEEQQQQHLSVPESHVLLLVDNHQERHNVSPADSMELRDIIKEEQSYQELSPLDDVVFEDHQEEDLEASSKLSSQVSGNPPYFQEKDHYIYNELIHAPLSQIEEVSELEVDDSEEQEHLEVISSSPHECTELLQGLEPPQDQGTVPLPKELLQEPLPTDLLQDQGTVPLPKELIHDHEPPQDQGTVPSPTDLLQDHEPLQEQGTVPSSTELLQDLKMPQDQGAVPSSTDLLQGHEPQQDQGTVPSCDGSIDTIGGEDEQLLPNNNDDDDDDEHVQLKRPLSSISHEKDIVDNHNTIKNNEIIVDCS